MINIIVGNNSLGTTVYLENLLNTIDIKSVITNMVNPLYLYKEEYNQDRIDILSDVLCTHNIEIGYNQLMITGAVSPIM